MGAPGDEPVVTGGFRRYGDYTVLEHLRFDLEGEARNTITIGKYEPGARNHIYVRYNACWGGQHVPTQSYQAIGILRSHDSAEVVSDLVIWGNHFHHIGDGRGEAHYDAVAVSVDAGAERVWIVDNYFHHIGGDGIQIACDAPDLGQIYTLPNHIYVAGFQAAAAGKGVGSLEADPLHADPAAADFHLSATSPAIDAGAAHPYFDLFFARYGIDLAVDAAGAPVPVDGTGDGSAVLDMGPLEYRP